MLIFKGKWFSCKYLSCFFFEALVNDSTGAFSKFFQYFISPLKEFSFRSFTQNTVSAEPDTALALALSNIEGTFPDSAESWKDKIVIFAEKRNRLKGRPDAAHLWISTSFACSASHALTWGLHFSHNFR